MALNYLKESDLFQSILSQHGDHIRSTVLETMQRLSRTPGATVGEPKGSMGQIPARARLSDCCEYTERNGLDHLGSFARAMDTPSMSDVVSRIYSTKRLVIIDLGSGASLTWILMALVAKHIGLTKEILVVNVDHAANMHRVSLALEEELSELLRVMAPRYERRQFIAPDGIDGFTSSELEGPTSVFIVLNHLLHQNMSSHLPVPDFVSTAISAGSRVAKSASNPLLNGVSLEPWNLNINFGQVGLSQLVQLRGGSVTEPTRVPGSRVGKSVIGFSLPTNQIR